MRKLTLLFLLLIVACSDNSGDSNKVESEQLILKCDYLEVNGEPNRYDPMIFILDNKNKGDKADVVFRGESYTSAPVTWTPSNIVIDFVITKDSGVLETTYYRKYTISRSTLSMKWSVYYVSRFNGTSIKQTSIGECEVSDLESNNNLF